MKKLIAIITLSLLLSPVAMAKEIAGINYDDKISVLNKNLVLNGVGIRKKAFIKVYTCGLYLQSKNSDGESIINADEPMAIKLVVTTKLVTKEKMQKAMTEGFEKSTNNNLAPLKDRIDRLNSFFNDEITKKDLFMMIYKPGTGVIIKKNGIKKGEISGFDFKKALFGIWIGKEPIDKKLKKKMLNL
ncbi:MAG: chalcone isomerase [Deltaproteobacteria bacterium]|nr:MAG: chalcone isomerase [Deltaproteobacteria bacterium]